MSRFPLFLCILLACVVNAQVQSPQENQTSPELPAEDVVVIDEESVETPVEEALLETPVDNEITSVEEDDTPLSEQVEDLKQAALSLNRDLLLLEEELLFPGNTQVAVFVSMDVGEFFQLDAVKVKIDDKVVGSHLYTDKQIDALFRGGIQRLYMGNLKSGTHEVSAFFTGKGPAGRDYKRAASFSFDKGSEPTLLELRIVDSNQKLQPVFDIKEWELP